jgi:hypothetical protein
MHNPEEFHIDGVYCSDTCRDAFKAKARAWAEKTFGKSD